MPGKTQLHSDAVLNFLRGIPVAPPATAYVGLFSVAPGDDAAAGTELNGNGYARQAVTFSAPVQGTGSARKIVNSATVTFGPASDDWPAAVAFGVFDAATAGNLLYFDSLAAPKTVANGDLAQFSAGQLTVSED